MTRIGFLIPTTSVILLLALAQRPALTQTSRNPAGKTETYNNAEVYKWMLK